MTGALPGVEPGTVSIVVPARDEEAHIAECLEAIAAQTYPRQRMQVLVVDGASKDGTSDVAAKALGRLGLCGEVLRSPTGTTPANLNVGLERSVGDVLCRVDAKSRIPPDYVARCVALLRADSGIAVVGGCPVAVAGGDGAVSLGIARALNNRWGMGFARYRSGGQGGPSDTVYLGAFRLETLRRVGGWDERFVVNQDFELNRRVSRIGTVWFDPELRVPFVPHATVSGLFRRHRRFGRGKVRYWRLAGEGPRPRQWVLLLGPPLAVAGGCAWVARPPNGRRLAALGLVGVGGMVAIEAIGADEPPARLGGHAAAAATLVAVGVGWLTGIVEELLRPGVERNR